MSQQYSSTNPSAEQPEGLTRKKFLDLLLSGSVVAFISAVLYPVVQFLKPPKQAEAVETSVKVGKLADLAKNSGKVVPFNNKPAIIVNTPKGELKAFTAVCTHLECTVQYRSDLEHIWCACHNGHYDLNGKNIAGPPPRPLEPYQVNVKGDDIYISKAT